MRKLPASRSNALTAKNGSSASVFQIIGGTPTEFSGSTKPGDSGLCWINHKGVAMKYNSLSELIAAAKSGEFTGYIVVDNDCVNAYQPVGDDDIEEVSDFNGASPERALVALLNEIGLNAGFA
jgi:hypothetical protein